MELDDAARRLDEARADVTAVGTRLSGPSPSAHDFGSAAAGALGDLGRALRSQAGATLRARADEAHALGAAMSDLAVSLRGAASAYRDVESTRGRSIISGGSV
jgi:hypothetical protein